MVAGNVADMRWNFQAAKGSAAATSAYAAFLAGGDLVRPQRTIEPFEESTGQQMRLAHYVSQALGAGVPEFFVPPKAMASLLYGVLGDVQTSGAGDPWTHAIKWAATRPWLTMWSHLGGGLFRENRDCRVDQLVITGEASRPLRVAATITALDPRFSTAAETTAVIEATDRVLYYDGKGALLFEGAAVKFLGFTLTIDRTPEIIYADDLLPIADEEGLFVVDLTLNRLWADAALDNRFHFASATPADHTAAVKDILTLAGSPAGVDFKFTRATGPERSLRVQCPTLQMREIEAPQNTDGTALREALTLSSYDDGSTEPITATVLNNMPDLTP